jgi:hypothetical protein
VQWDVEIGVVLSDGELYFTRYLGDPSPELTPLTEPMHMAWSDPLVLVGRLPAGTVGVRAFDQDMWDSVEVNSGVWLASTAQGDDVDPLGDLEFTRSDGTSEPISPDAAEDPATEPLPPVSDEGRAYATVVASALAEDVVRHGPPGPLRRTVIRWFWDGDPAYLTLHVLGAGDEQPPREDAWSPLEWANHAREFERTDRVLARPDVTRAAETLSATFPRDADGEVDGYAHVPAVEELVTRLPAALAAAGIELSDRFAVSAAHFEGWGVLDVLRGTAPPELLEALADHDELPEE